MITIVVGISFTDNVKINLPPVVVHRLSQASCIEMDDVERQINLAESFLAEAKVKAEAVRNIADLPQYVDQRLIRLICDIERIDNVKSSIAAVRKAIPDGAIEAERERLKNGSQQSLI